MSHQPPGPPYGPPPGQWGARQPPPPRPKSKRVPILIGVGAFIAVMAIIGTVTGGKNGNDNAAPAATEQPTTASAPTPTKAQAAPKPPTTVAAAKQATVPVPRFIGMGLQAAQDAAQAKGFFSLISHDSSGRDRMQILDRDWQVCSQKPAPGTKVSADTTLDFGAVKLEESCPATDQKPPAKAGASMPNFVGKSLNTATEALPADTSITPNDVSGQDRIIIVESNWRVCLQTPAAGTPLRGQPVTFGAVKFGESCP
jgi:pyruvate/2-oxoglutarate dehydrogenase complex dihydrolipoamide acyltransferase (E2) component